MEEKTKRFGDLDPEQDNMGDDGQRSPKRLRQDPDYYEMCSCPPDSHLAPYRQFDHDDVMVFSFSPPRDLDREHVEYASAFLSSMSLRLNLYRDSTSTSASTSFPSEGQQTAGELIDKLRSHSERREKRRERQLWEIERIGNVYKCAPKDSCRVSKQFWIRVLRAVSARYTRWLFESKRYLRALARPNPDQVGSGWELFRQHHGEEITHEHLHTMNVGTQVGLFFEYARSHPHGELYQLAPFKAHLGWPSRSFNLVCQWMQKLWMRPGDSNLAKLMVTFPYWGEISSFLAIDDVFRAFAARLSHKTADTFARKLLRAMAHFEHRCRQNVQVLVLDNDESTEIATGTFGSKGTMSSSVATISPLLAGATSSYLDACFLLKRITGSYCTKRLRIVQFFNNRAFGWTDSEIQLRPIAFSLATCIWLDWTAPLQTQYPIDARDTAVLARLMNRHHIWLGDIFFGLSGSATDPQSGVEEHWRGIQLDESGRVIGCLYCDQIAAASQSVPERAQAVSQSVACCTTVLRELKRSLTSRPEQLLHVRCVIVSRSFSRSSGLMAGITPSGVVCGVAWSSRAWPQAR